MLKEVRKQMTALYFSWVWLCLSPQSSLESKTKTVSYFFLYYYVVWEAYNSGILDSRGVFFTGQH